jgi:hypothetical protein
MKRIPDLLSLALVCLPLAGCMSYSSDETFVAGGDQVIARRDHPDGSRDTYLLQTHAGDGTLRVESEFDRVRTWLGFRCEELDAKRAQKRGVQPYQGLLVTGVKPQSSALAGGVLAGDVLLALDTTPLVYGAQLEAFESNLREGQTVVAKLLRGQVETELRLLVTATKERATDRKDVPLDVPTVGHPYAGVALRGIPASWCERIFGQPRQAVVVASVEVGAPAWHAGVRAGDVSDREPVSDVHALSQRIVAEGQTEGTMRWLVSRDGKTHEAEVHLRDYRDRTDVWLPLVFRYRDAPSRNRWGVGPLGSLIHNTTRVVADGSTRAVRTHNEFGMLLNLIHVETDEDDTRVRLLWFIRFDT